MSLKKTTEEEKSLSREKNRRNFRKVKSLNLRKPEDLENVAQGIDDLLELMKLKQILGIGEIDHVAQHNTVLKNKKLLNQNVRSSRKLPDTPVKTEDADKLKAQLMKKKASQTDDSKKKSSLKEDIPVPESIHGIKALQEWEDVEESHKTRFWQEHTVVEGEYHYGIAIKGWRDTMEDTMDYKSSVNPEAPNMFAVYDGHGGDSCANFCKRQLLQQVAKTPRLKTDAPNTLTNIFMGIDQDYGQAFQDGKAGATATALVVIPQDNNLGKPNKANAGVATTTFAENPRHKSKKKKGRSPMPGDMSVGERIIGDVQKRASLQVDKRTYKYHCACVGDSRAVLVYASGKVEALSKDHNLRRKDELERIRQADGEIRYDPEFNELLVYSREAERGLNVTRTIGDKDFKPWVMALPEIKSGFLTEDSAYFVIASDGLWAHVLNREVGDMVREFGLQEGLKNLANLANKRGCYDNCTLVGVDIQKMLEKIEATYDS